VQCRFCHNPLTYIFVDLGKTPLSNSFLNYEDTAREVFYPLRVYVCEKCFLVQISQVESPKKIFQDYAYFSSYSDSWLDHVRNYSEMITNRLDLNSHNFVIEIASNDGYLLQYFQKKGIPHLGIEPAENVAKVALQKGLSTRIEFFGVDCANRLVQEGKRPDLLIGNNVLAHVPDLNDFVAGMKILLKPNGLITLEFPHLLQLISKNQFDTIYHEHFSYFSLMTVEKVLAYHGLKIFDVEELNTHGGSLRIFVSHKEVKKADSPNLNYIRDMEYTSRLNSLDTYLNFDNKVKEVKEKLVTFLKQEKGKGKTIVGYGAPAKGNTLLNYCGIGPDLLEFTVDRNSCKQGKVLPGTHIPIFSPLKIKEKKPDYLLILPWNIKEEVIKQMGCLKEWQGRFIIPIPEVTLI